MNAPEQVYRLLLRAYPAEFRAAWGQEMELVFRDRWKERSGNVSFWAEIVLDVVRSAPAIRLQAARRHFTIDITTWGVEMKAMAILAILIGSLETAGGLREAWAGGMQNQLPSSLWAGTVGGVAGMLLVATGIALLRRSPGAVALARVAAAVCIPVFVLIGLVNPVAGYLATGLGIGFPVALMLFLFWTGRGGLSSQPHSA